MQSLARRRGFTLIELMITVGIVGIIASVALPRYYYFQLRSKRSEAFLTIGAVKASEESFLASFDNYAACAPDPPGPPSIAVQPWVVMPCPAGCSAANPAACTTFECVGFRPSARVFFQYATGVLLSPALNATPELGIGALSDLDADGVVASFSIQTNNAKNPLNMGQCADGFSACPAGIEADNIIECVPLAY